MTTPIFLEALKANRKYWEVTKAEAESKHGWAIYIDETMARNLFDYHGQIPDMYYVTRKLPVSPEHPNGRRFNRAERRATRVRG